MKQNALKPYFLRKVLLTLTFIMTCTATYTQMPNLMLPLTHTGEITGLTRSKDGKFFATGGVDKLVKLWDTRTGKLLYNFTGFSTTVNSIDFHPNSQTLLIASDTSLYEYNIYSGKLIQVIRSGRRTGKCIFSTDGKLVVFASSDWDGVFTVYNYQEKKVIGIVNAHEDFIREMAFSPDGKYIVTASRQELRLWDVATLKKKGEKQYTGQTDRINSIAIHPNSKKMEVVISELGMFFYSLPDLKEFAAIKHKGDEEQISDADYSPDGKQFATVNTNGQISVWDEASRKVVKSFYVHDTSTYNISVPQELLFDVSGKKIMFMTAFVVNIQMFHIDSGKELFKITKSAVRLNSAKFDISGSMIVTASDDDKIKIWSTRVGRLLSTISGHTDIVNSATFSMVSDLMASSGYDRTVRIWDWTQQKLLRTIKLPGYGRMNISISRDGKKVLALVHADSAAYVYDVASGSLHYKLYHDNWLSYGTYSHDGKLLAMVCVD